MAAHRIGRLIGDVQINQSKTQTIFFEIDSDILKICIFKLRQQNHLTKLDGLMSKATLVTFTFLLGALEGCVEMAKKEEYLAMKMAM